MLRLAAAFADLLAAAVADPALSLAELPGLRATAVPPRPARPVRIPLSYAQRGRWFLHHLDGGAEFATPKSPHRALHPSQQMDSVGDVANWNFVNFSLRIKRLPHLPADTSVKFADRIGGTGHAQGQHGHVTGAVEPWRRLRLTAQRDYPDVRAEVNRGALERAERDDAPTALVVVLDEVIDPGAVFETPEIGAHGAGVEREGQLETIAHGRAGDSTG